MLRQKKIAPVQSVNPEWENLSVEKAEIAPDGARSLHCGRDDRKMRSKRELRCPFFPIRAEHQRKTQKVQAQAFPACDAQAGSLRMTREKACPNVADRPDKLSWSLFSLHY
jgi:hypothetical protein